MVRITCEDICDAPKNWTGKPVCVAADGLPVLDDVGGINGFYHMLVTLNECDRDDEEYSSMREWARGMGWTGRKMKPENML